MIDCRGRPLVMGIVNVNDDSFSGDGTLDFEAAWELAARQVADGADMVDIGAESARTNRGAVSPDEEVRRLVGWLTLWTARAGRLRPRFDDQLWPPLLSINAWRPEVIERVLPLGGDLLNDIGGMPDDRTARLCAEHGAALLIMHSVGQPKVPHTHVRYPDVVAAVDSFFAEKLALSAAAGLDPEAIVLDPGLDFAKQRDDNLRLIAQLDRFHRFGRPLLLPVSRKTFIGETLNLPDPRDRDPGSIAALVAGQVRGAHIFRMHNARAAAEAVRLVDACRMGPIPGRHT
ncbi:MAG: dihydropteroate synthase [Verrucomicrobiales bacterium]